MKNPTSLIPTTYSLIHSFTHSLIHYPLPLFFLPVLLLTGCVKETSWTNATPMEPVPVVDGRLTDEVKNHEIRLTQTSDALNALPVPLSGAEVLVSNEDSAWTLSEDTTRPGIYLTPGHFSAQTGKYYTLQVFLGDRVYTARDQMVPGAFFRELRYARNEENGLYYVDWVANAFSAEQPAMWELLLDWSMVPGYQYSGSSETHARMLFYTLTTLDVSELFAPAMQSVYFPAGTIITERRYSLSPGHAAFVRDMLLETNWTGGLFPVAPANVSTNLSSGALGFFGVCAVTEVSVVVTP